MAKKADFVDLVRESGILPEDDIRSLLRASAGDPSAVLRHIIAKSLMPREQALKLWADNLGVAWIDLTETLFQQEVVTKVPKEFAKKHHIIFIYKFGGAITAAMADPLDARVVGEAERICGEKVSAVFACREDIENAIEVQYNFPLELKGIADKFDFLTVARSKNELSGSDLQQLAGNKGVSEFVRGLLLLAYKERASDIHLEPAEGHVRVRFRVDGLMAEKMRLTHEAALPVVSRLKLEGGMDITERRRPQDGRIALPLTDFSVDFRLSTIPTIYGEKATLRILGDIHSTRVPDMEDLHFSADVYERMKTLIKTPNGVLFITGPTGSGKTTTLFSALKAINRREINIVTVEDPVEYRLPGINQIQINREIGLTFASVLRSVLRQDPDVILIGEIRDLETAKIATEAALTGHLVFSTLHTNDAVQAVTRLVEIGVEPFIVGPSIIGVMAQRLVRRICPACRESYAPPKAELDRLFEWDGGQEVYFSRGKGCQACNFSGYKGRLGIYEMLIVTEGIRELVSQNHSIGEIREAAKKSGYRPMRYDGIKKVLRGMTTLEEVERVSTYSD